MFVGLRRTTKIEVLKARACRNAASSALVLHLHVALELRPSDRYSRGISYYDRKWDNRYEDMACKPHFGTVSDATFRCEPSDVLPYLLFTVSMHDPGLVQGKSVLELGSGVGLLGIIIAAIQLDKFSKAGRIRLTDVNSHVLKRCVDNMSVPCSTCQHPSSISQSSCQ